MFSFLSFLELRIEPRMEGNSGGGGGGGSGGVIGGGIGNDVELLCKTLQVEHKLFYFDLKENPRGRYLKISEKTSATRSTIIVPFSGISWFLDLFNYYVNSDDQEVFSKELQLDTKAFLSFLYPSHLFYPFCYLLYLQIVRFQVFYFDIGENRRGRFLKVLIIVPPLFLESSSLFIILIFLAMSLVLSSISYNTSCSTLHRFKFWMHFFLK